MGRILAEVVPSSVKAAFLLSTSRPFLYLAPNSSLSWVLCLSVADKGILNPSSFLSGVLHCCTIRLLLIVSGDTFQRCRTVWYMLSRQSVQGGR